MLTPLSILSLDQGPKWREPDDTGAPAEPRVPEAASIRRRTAAQAIRAWLAGLVPWAFPA